MATISTTRPTAAVPILGRAPLRDPAARDRSRSGLVEAALRWQQRAQERYALAETDGRLLRDIGIDRLDALAEARKPFWRP